MRLKHLSNMWSACAFPRHPQKVPDETAHSIISSSIWWLQTLWYYRPSTHTHAVLHRERETVKLAQQSLSHFFRVHVDDQNFGFLSLSFEYELLLKLLLLFLMVPFSPLTLGKDKSFLLIHLVWLVLQKAKVVEHFLSTYPISEMNSNVFLFFYFFFQIEKNENNF